MFVFLLYRVPNQFVDIMRLNKNQWKKPRVALTCIKECRRYSHFYHFIYEMHLTWDDREI